eukprot:TRINITY_DN1997_c0_g1_i1.p1 TRINITY_DN1997_c0_g1~~TRINITY_DN1997_c0_g1_i1.p1  ORF type:complete len:103 (+),score=11.22 TRINITY_DN1997_c0_g1_i1:182-490(+)
MRRAPINIGAICRSHSWSQRCCNCVVRGESGGNAHSQNYNGNGTYDVGVFQINQIHWRSCSGGKAPCNVTTNLRCAIGVYRGAHNRWRPWMAARRCGCTNSP